MCCGSANSRHPPLVQVIGASGSGKTTLIERLIPRLRVRPLRVGTVKHAHHGFEMDRPGTDSWRHARSGAEAVAVIAPSQAAWVRQTSEAPGLAEAVASMNGHVDLILVEGFSGEITAPRIQLEPAAGMRLEVVASRCRVGVDPAELSEDEWQTIVRFCVERLPCRAP